MPSTLTKPGTPPSQMLPKDLQGVQLHPPSSQLTHVAALAREMEHEHHELAFDTARVQEVTVGALDWMLWAEVWLSQLLDEHGGNPPSPTELACVLHLYCTRLLQGANRHRLKVALSVKQLLLMAQ